MNLLTASRSHIAGGTALAAFVCQVPAGLDIGQSAAVSSDSDYSRITRSVLDSSWISFSRRLPLEVEFGQLVAEWKLATQFESSPGRMAAHPAYRRITGMGERAIPFLLREMSREPDFWFDALTAITGEQPIPVEHAGKVAAMAEDWLQWGRQHGYEC